MCGMKCLFEPFALHVYIFYYLSLHYKFFEYTPQVYFIRAACGPWVQRLFEGIVYSRS